MCILGGSIMKNKKELQNRVKRVKGQIAGVEKMIEENRACLDTVQQIAAARSALAKVGVELLKNEAYVCARQPEGKNFEDIIESLFKLS